MSDTEGVSPPMFQAGLFETGPGGPWLLGTRCRSCNRTFYPRTGICLNCLADDLEERRLSSEGVLECFTTVQMPALHIAPPYCVGYVLLPEGLRIFAPIEAHDRTLCAGMTMRLAEYALGRGPDKSLAYCFEPA